MSLAAPIRRLGLALVLVKLVPSTAHAGGPTLIGNRVLGTEGQPLVWDNSVPIRYTTDGGSLGTLSNDQANALVAQIFAVWQSVPGRSPSPAGTSTAPSASSSRSITATTGWRRRSRTTPTAA